MKKDKYGNYSALDRYRILGDVAPYSDQYRAAQKEMALLNQNGLLDERQQAEYRTIRKQVSSKKVKNNFYAERFGNAKIEKQTVTVTKVIDNNTFLTEEHPNTPMKLAGVQVSNDDKEALALVQQVIRPGARLEIGIDADPNRRIRDDMLETTRVVVYTPGMAAMDSTLRAGENLNYRLSKDPGVTSRDDGSAVATQALHSPGLLTIGKFSEWMVHDVIPTIPVVNIFADTFLPAQSALEAYKDKIYSKDFRDWKQPIDGWIKPMVDKLNMRNPLQAALHGAGIGYLFGGRKNRWNKTYAGALIGGTLSSFRVIRDVAKRMDGDETNDVWIPERRVKEREVDEYFDKIKYVKYKGLYEKAKQLAKKDEGIDLDAFYAEQKTRGDSNKKLKSYLNNKKKWLSITEKSGGASASAKAKEELALVNEELKVIDGDRPSVPVGSYAALALRYKDEYESTLLGAQEDYNFMKIYRALPKKDKEFFNAFLEASPKERQEIIGLVPKNQRRIYQQQFGMKQDDEENLEEYFKKHNMPGKNWEGWRPDVSLDNIKVKVMREEGVELTEANYWGEAQMQSDNSGVKAVPIHDSSMGLLSGKINKGKLEEALIGAGLTDVRVQMNVSKSDVAYFNTKIKIERQREAEIEEGLKSYLNE